MKDDRLVIQIKEIYHLEKKKEIQFDEVDLPTSYENITVDWLTKYLCTDILGARVNAFELGEADNGSSNRRGIIVQYNKIGQDNGLPEKLFCKASHGLNNRLVLGVTGAILSEVTFFNKISPVVEMETPTCFFAKYNPKSCNSLIILKDISDKVERFCTHETHMDMLMVKSQLEELAKLHSCFLEKKDLIPSVLGTWPEWFARSEKLGMKEGSNKGFLAAKEVIPERLYKRYSEVWPKTKISVDRHNELPQTVVHNDVHLSNWYCLEDRKMGITDWQGCSRGHWGRDIAYAISTACTVENRRLWEKDLIAYYLEMRGKYGSEAPIFEEAWHHYRQQLLSALTWWTITLTPTSDMPDMQPRERTLEFIRRISTAIDDLGSLDV